MLTSDNLQAWRVLALTAQTGSLSETASRLGIELSKVSRLITSLLRFEPDSPEWQILENIYNSIAAEKESRE